MDGLSPASGGERGGYQGLSKKELLEKRLRDRQQLSSCSIGTSLERGQAERHRKAQNVQPFRDPATDPLNTPLYCFQVQEVFEHDIPNMRTPSVAIASKTQISSVPTTRKVRMLQTQDSSAKGATASIAGMLATVDPDEVLMSCIQTAVSKRPKSERALIVAPDDVKDISTLQTAEDVIAFFSKTGNSSAVKFVYLNRAQQGLLFRPYDLQVVMRGKQEPEHFCISASGCVHVKPGHPSEVVSLAEWMRECTLFNVLTRIHFFKNYLVGKSFTQWRRNVRFRLYCQTRRRLCKNFFISKHTFTSTLAELHKTAFELSTIPLVYYPEIKETYTHEKFKEEQNTLCRVPAEQEFRTCMDRMENKLLKLCETVTQRANVPDLTTQESLEQYLLANATVNGKDRGKGGRG